MFKSKAILYLDGGKGSKREFVFYFVFDIKVNKEIDITFNKKNLVKKKIIKIKENEDFYKQFREEFDKLKSKYFLSYQGNLILPYFEIETNSKKMVKDFEKSIDIHSKIEFNSYFYPYLITYKEMDFEDIEEIKEYIEEENKK